MPAGSAFPETPWSLIAQAAYGDGDKRELLRQLLERYWQPVYRTMRLGWDLPDAKARELVHVFLNRLLDPDVLGELDPQRTRFRDFLKARLAGFMEAHGAERIEPDRAPRARFELTELLEVPVSTGAPDEVFDEQWILLVFHRALRRLEAATREKQPHVYGVFETWDVRGARPADDELAQELGISASTVQPALRQARRMFRRFVVAEVQEYAADSDHAREELKWLLH